MAAESSASWPKVTKIFNAFVGEDPIRQYSSDTQAPYQRAQGYPKHFYAPKTAFTVQGKPQLTWFEGTYEIPAMFPSGIPGMCRYPEVLTQEYAEGSNLRMCINPTKMTDAQRAAYEAEKKKQEDAIAAAIKASVPTDAKAACAKTPPYYINGKQVYSKTDPKTNLASYYDCQTDAQVGKSYPAVRGLGATELEKESLARQTKSYRMTELALLGVFAAGAFLIWKR